MIKNQPIGRITKITVLILFVNLFIYACSENNAKNKNYFENLNGFWVGTKTVQQVGDCFVGGGSIASVNSVIQCEINNEGNVEILEYFFNDSLNMYYYKDSSAYNWSGTISKEYEYNLQKPGFTNCFGEPREYFTQYEGTIINENDVFTFNSVSVEEWCPEQNCIFNVKYDLTQVDSSITNIINFDEMPGAKK